MHAVAPAVDQEKLKEAKKQALAREHFLAFVKYMNPDYVVELVHRYVAFELERFVLECEQGLSPRLILQMPPQHGKSTLSSRYLPAWILGRNPKWKNALMSYSADWATALGGDARDIVADERYREVFPNVEIDQSSTAKDEWSLTKKSGGGGLKAVGRDGGITGRPAHVLLIDDFLKNRKEAESDTIRTEINEGYGPNFRTRVQKGGGILMVATPWHYLDLMAHVQQVAQDDPKADQWRVIRLEALAPEDEFDPLGRQPGEPLAPNLHDAHDLAAIQASIPERDWQALYRCRPTASEGAIFKDQWFIFEDDPGGPGIVMLASDTAYSEQKGAAYTVIEIWRVEHNCYRLLHVYRNRPDYPTLRQDTLNLFDSFEGLAILLENMASGKSLVQELRRETRIPVIDFNPRDEGDKTNRAYSVTPMFAGGKVRLPKSAPWLAAWLKEHREFPMGAYKDQVDTTSMFLLWAQKQRWTPRITEPVTHSFVWNPSKSQRPRVLLTRGAR